MYLTVYLNAFHAFPIALLSIFFLYSDHTEIMRLINTADLDKNILKRKTLENKLLCSFSSIYLDFFTKIQNLCSIDTDEGILNI